MVFTESNVASANANTKLLDAAANRRGFMIFNDSSAILYLSYGGTAAATSPVKVAAGAYYTDELMRLADKGSVGPQINGFWASANGYARIVDVVAE